MVESYCRTTDFERPCRRVSLRTVIHQTFLQKLNLLSELSLESGLEEVQGRLYLTEKGFAGQASPVTQLSYPVGPVVSVGRSWSLSTEG